MPLGVSAIRGVGRPVRALLITDFVTTPPRSCRGKNCASSRPELAHPLAVKIGFGNQAFPIVVERSTLVIKLDLLCPTEHRHHP